MRTHIQHIFFAVLRVGKKYYKQLSLFAAALCGVIFCIMAMVFMTIPLEGDNRLFFSGIFRISGLGLLVFLLLTGAPKTHWWRNLSFPVKSLLFLSFLWGMTGIVEIIICLLRSRG